ncbi:MAG TPA: endonuclease/exonuclease/phosphatase family protein [Burkholderiales bacterium]|nr:endonuclease/exonuclease/phosphatase family protein [Burkholderiales bacterium]
MRLISWNVQWCRGMDGRVDPKRIAAEARRLADPDVLCLQEVACNFPEMEGSAGEDQVLELTRSLEGYEGFFAPAVDIPGKKGRRRFGNLVLTRLPAGRVMRHSLPWPASPGVPSMPRAVVEVVVDSGLGPVRVMTTHLEYYSAEHRDAQIGRLGEIHLEACAAHLRVDEPGSFESHERPSSAVLCGDFNLKPDDPLHRKILDAGFADAWQALHPGKPHPHTFKLYDKNEKPYCCDYVFVTRELAPRLRAIRIDSQTQASDHQPVMVELG